MGDVADTSRLAVEWNDENAVREPSTDNDVTLPLHGSQLRTKSEGTNIYSSTKVLQLRPPSLVTQQQNGSVMFPTTVSTKNSYSVALLGSIREQFLPDSVYMPPAIDSMNGKPWESDQFLWTPCAFWVTSALTKASKQETSLLKNSMLSIGMLLKSFQFQDASLKIASLELYRRCLQGIRKSLEPFLNGRQERPKDAVALYLSCHAAAMFELVQNSDLSATMHHLRGVSQLICHLSDNRDEEGQSVAWLLLQDYRLAEMGLCLKFRYASVTSLRRRQYEHVAFGKFRPSSKDISAHGYGSHNMLVRITDMADDISAVMVQLDTLRPRLERADASIKLRRLIAKLETTWAGYQYLHDQLTSRYGSNFVHRDVDDEGPASSTLKFKTFDVGAAWCYNLMTQIYCVETQIEATTMALNISRTMQFDRSLTVDDYGLESNETCAKALNDVVSYQRLRELRQLHRTICIQLTHCLQYFLQTDKGITGQALAIFPLDTAISMLECEMQRLKADLVTASDAQRSSTQVASIQQDITSLLDAREYCQKMEERAKAFGLPGFQSAGPTTATGY